MTEGMPSDTDEAAESITPAALKARIDGGDEVFILDVRAEGEFDEWHIDGETVEVVNYPYFQLLDGIPENVLADLPRDRTITVLCARGGSSELIAEHVRDEGFDVNHLERGMKGWARIYEYTELDVDVDATIAQYQRPSSGCLAYLVASDGKAAVIDPLRAFTDQYLQDARALGVELTYAIDTHVHADHVSGVRKLAELAGSLRAKRSDGVREFGGENDTVAILPEPAADRGVEYDVPYQRVADGDVLPVGDVEIEVVHTPGHTTGMTAYAVGDVLFTGDGLFTESVARPDLEDPEAARRAARTLHESLTEKVLTRSDETVIAPAHFSDVAVPNDDDTFTAELGDLKATMNALSMDEDTFVDFIVSNMPPRPANYEEIIATNLGQKSPDDERAFELELGPNNCAASEEALTN